MVTFPSAPASDRSSPILCYYVNCTNQIQIARTVNGGRSFERIVFPMERFMFEAPSEALLEIYTGEPSAAEPLEQIPCLTLQVSEVDRMMPIAQDNNDSDER